MATEAVFQFSNPSTWVPSLAAGAAGLYGLARILRRDKRNDNQERRVDDAVNQVIETLRAEVARLGERVTQLEGAYIKCQVENTHLRTLLSSHEADQQNQKNLI